MSKKNENNDVKLKNPATMSNSDLIDEATYLKKQEYIDFDENTTRQELIKKVVEGRKLKFEDNKTPTDNSDDKNAGDAENSPNEVHYYWLKFKSYADNDPLESEELLPAGLYLFNERKPRLDRAPKRYVEHFEGSIPERALLKIAESRGIKYDASDKVDFDNLLQRLLNPVKYIQF